MKSGDFKVTKTGVVNTAVEEKVEEPDEPPDDVDVKEFVDFYGQNNVNLLGMYKAEPDEDDAFGFSGVGFAQFEFASVNAFGRCDEGVKLDDVCGEWP